MNEGYKKIFWGVIIISFNLNLGIINLFPSFVGWIIVLLGIEQINEESDVKPFINAKNATILMVVLSSIGSLLGLFGATIMENSLVFLYYPALLLGIELIIFQYIIEGFIVKRDTLSLTDREEIYVKKDRNYILFMGIIISITIFSLTFNHSGTKFLAVIMTLLVRAYALSVIKAIKHEKNTMKDNSKRMNEIS